MFEGNVDSGYEPVPTLSEGHGLLDGVGEVGDEVAVCGDGEGVGGVGGDHVAVLGPVDEVVSLVGVAVTVQDVPWIYLAVKLPSVTTGCMMVISSRPINHMSLQLKWRMAK